ncbi:endo-1,4-beta-xylanase [Psychrosphaera sp. 1_MG-2023]|uniref:endo-1,4-beta-xylanase n=1 Tax=Psychrosphaera sp. 1_MG-2023 TaxID=3062643 RepID=UPI0026E29F45|nr:endo-1,4-beta-xylanase [Psychrosphaera sp. 1_MG-2023]MDO6719462.1 endo-1,4-beta-xylanase [Psychrosphaera sp. 1_MG-2023]
MYKCLTFAMLLLVEPITVSAHQEVELKTSFADAFKMGVAVNQDIVTGKDAAAYSIITKQFNTVTLENAMKAEAIYPSRDNVDFSGADAFIEFAQKYQMFTVGHTLVWHNQTPSWFFHNRNNEPNTPKQQLEQMRKHIELVAGRYRDKVDAWDVVNEVIADDGTYRPTTWVNSVGDGDTMVKAAFKYAQQYSPNTELYYNDFNAWRPTKRDGIVRMVKMLQKEGIRIDGVGIQAHWGLNFPRMEYIEDAIDAYSALGIKVMITELDIDVLPLTKEGQIIGVDMMKPQFQLEEFETFLDPYKAGLPEDIEAQLTARYKALFELFYKKRDKIDRVTFWGLHDGMSWKNGYPIPNRTNYPLLWDRNLNPKPAVKAIAEVVK